MAGVYIHIPFCHKACHYCDFHFSTQMTLMLPMAESIAREAHMRAAELGGATVDSVYFGGGTPSLMPPAQLRSIHDAIHTAMPVSPGAEYTLEANPDDLTADRIAGFRTLGINRLSIGIQSFDDATLQWMNRSHNAAQAIACVALARKSGIQAVSIDLIYGLAGLTPKKWEDTLRRAIDMEPDHISAYCLTVEEKTVLGHRVRKGLEKPVDEEAAAAQFARMVEVLHDAGYEQYEVSNFAREGRYARHNTSYWLGTPYLGLGPSAHSYTGHRRQWNIANNARYIQSIKAGELPLTEEILTPRDQYNEWVMTGLRTKWGISAEDGRARFGLDISRTYLLYIQSLQERELAVFQKGRLTLTRKGMFHADGIASEFFRVEDD